MPDREVSCSQSIVFRVDGISELNSQDGRAVQEGFPNEDERKVLGGLKE